MISSEGHDYRMPSIKHLSAGALKRADGLAGVVRENPLLAGVAGIGFSVSFQTVAHIAWQQGMPGPPVLYPVGIDIGILALITEALHLIREGRSDFVPRLLAWLLTGFTIYVNVHGSPAGDWLGGSLHVVMPALWVVCLELVRHRRVAAGRADSIPAGRWVASPLPTLRLWLRMKRDGITSYPLALELDHARLFARDLIRAAPKQYRPRRSSLICKRVRTGRLQEDVRKAVAATIGNDWAPGWESAVAGWITDALGLSSRMAASLENANREIALKAAQVTAQAEAEAIAQAPAAPAPETVSGQPSGQPPVTAQATPRVRTARKPKAAQRIIPKADLEQQVRALFDADHDVTIAYAAAKLGRGRDTIRPILQELRRNANVVQMERRA